MVLALELLLVSTSVIAGIKRRSRRSIQGERRRNRRRFENFISRRAIGWQQKPSVEEVIEEKGYSSSETAATFASSGCLLYRALLRLELLDSIDRDAKG